MARRRFLSRFRRQTPRAAAAPQVTVIEQRAPMRQRAASAARRTFKSVRDSRIGQATYSAISSDMGVQVGCEVAEATAALLKGAMDMVAATSETKADDTAFPILQKATGSGVRYLADKFVSKKHPGLAKVMSAFGSGMSSCVSLDFFRARGMKATRVAAERLQGG